MVALWQITCYCIMSALSLSLQASKIHFPSEGRQDIYFRIQMQVFNHQGERNSVDPFSDFSKGGG